MMLEGEDLMNIMTKVVMLTEVQKDVCNQDVIGQKTYNKFGTECINTNGINLWVRMEKIKLKMWRSAKKAIKHKLAD